MIKYRRFSIFSRYKMDLPTLLGIRRKLRDRDPAKFKRLLEKLKPIYAELEDLENEAKVLGEDRLKITTSVRAASDMSTWRNPSTEDMEVLHELSEHYSAFFDGEDSETDERSLSTLNELMKLRRYVKKEQKFNEDRLSALKAKVDTLKKNWHQEMEWILLNDPVEKPGSTSAPSVESTESTSVPSVKRTESTSVPSVEKPESTSASSVERTGSTGKYFSLEKGESSKRKSDSISDSDDSSVSSSSKKKRPTPSDYIDDLPESPYNPFDDID